MLIKKNETLRLFGNGKMCVRLILLFCMSFFYFAHPIAMYGEEIASNLLEGITLDGGHCSKYKKLEYYLLISDFAQSFIEIPTSNVAVDSSTISSRYLAGRAALYNLENEKVGTCSASFLCIQNQDGIFTDISNYLSVDNGLIVTWFTPTTLINLELDSIIRSMVTKCIVVASTKVGFNPFFGKTFNLVVSSDDQKIYFKFRKR